MRQCKFFLLFIFFLFQTYSLQAKPEEKKVVVTLFFEWSCPHCVKEKAFLEKIQKKYPFLEIQAYELSSNSELLFKMSSELHFQSSSMPITIINKRYLIGFQDENTTGRKIEEMIVEEYNGHSDRKISIIPNSISIPFVGDIELEKLSLPLLSITLGAIDGFNPCAMWVLVLLLSFLINIQDRKKLIILGGLFLLTSAVFYFLVLVAWLNVMLLLSYLSIIKISIGVLAVLGGGFYIKEYFTNKEGTCNVTSTKQKKFISEKLEKFVNEKKFLLAAVAMIGLAFVVNFIELVCSAGIPAVYTQVLALTPLTSWEYYFQIFLYLLFFLLDDITVFLIAVFSLKLMNLTHKYTRFSHIIGGSLLVIIGFLLIFKPEWLMFA